MSIVKYLILYVISFIAFLAIDFIWLGFISRNLYKDNIGHLMADKVNVPAAFVFYLLFVVGVIVFAVLPGVEDENLTKTLLLGALFGFISYATYDLTNWATLKDWPAKIVFIDMAWGAFLSASVSLVGYLVGIRM